MPATTNLVCDEPHQNMVDFFQDLKSIDSLPKQATEIISILEIHHASILDFSELLNVAYSLL